MKNTLINGKQYELFIVDDYKRWTYAKISKLKDEYHSVFLVLRKQVHAEKRLK